MISKSINGSICFLTFDSPKGNLLTFEDLLALKEHLDCIKTDNSIGGIILTGKGRSFSTGLDTSQLLENMNEEHCSLFFKTFDALLIDIFSYSKPVVAAVNGHSIGGGFLIQNCADFKFVIDNEKIKIGLPELKLGVTVDALMTSLLSFSAVNYNMISKLLYDTNYITPAQAYEFGFADEILPEELLIDKSLEKLDILMAYKREAFIATKNIVRQEVKYKMIHAQEQGTYNIFNDLLKIKQ